MRIWVTKCLQIWHLWVLTFSPENTLIKFSHIHRHAIIMQNTLLCDCLSIWCAMWATKWLQLWHLRVLKFSPNTFAFIKYNITDLQIRLFKMMYLHAWFRAKLISWVLFFFPNNEIIKFTDKYMMNRSAIVDWIYTNQQIHSHWHGF